MTDTGFRQRLAAILVADAAGYSRLMAADERGTIAALDSARTMFRRQIEAYQGRVIDMAGDSVLALFETATGAVSAALAVQRDLDAPHGGVLEDRQMRFRIGVHLGDVFEKSDGTAYGDGVNVASRLQAMAEPGGVIVSESVRAAVKGKLEAVFTDEGEKAPKNIAEPVRTWSVSGTAPIPEPGKAALQPKPAITTSFEVDLSLPDKPSIAVLPFTNLSGDVEQEHFCDGVVEDIITELSRFKSLFVISRNSSFTYKDRAVDVRTVARELGVRYVLEGSIRRADDRVRVTGQLIDALSGTHLWAERYDRVLEDIFAVQEDLTRTIVMAIAPEIDASEIAKAQRSRPDSLSAYQLGLRAATGCHTAYLNSDAAARRRALELADEALSIDPRCVPALSALASAHFQEVVFRTTQDAKASYQLCVEASERALAVDRSEHQPYLWRGMLEVFSATPAVKAAGLSGLRRALENNPNDAMALACLAHGEAVCGNHVRGRELALEALRMSPRDPIRFAFANTLALAHFLAKDYAAGIDWALRSASEAPKFLSPHEHAVMNYVGLGRIEEARHELALVRRAAPEQTEMLLRRGQLHLSDPEQRARATLFFRIAAGMENPSAADALR